MPGVVKPSFIACIKATSGVESHGCAQGVATPAAQILSVLTGWAIMRQMLLARLRG